MSLRTSITKRLPRGVLCLAIVLGVLSGSLWLASTRWTVFVMAAQFGDSVALKSGGLSYSWTSAKLRARLSTQFNEPLEPRWEWHLGGRSTPMEWMPVHVASPTGRQLISIPLWMPLVFAFGFAAIHWRLNAKPMPGCCTKCGYSLSGLPAPSPCPECGKRSLRALFQQAQRLARQKLAKSPGSTEDRNTAKSAFVPR